MEENDGKHSDRHKAMMRAMKLLNTVDSLEEIKNLPEEAPIARCPNCHRKMMEIENFQRCLKCNFDFMKLRGKIYIWNRDAGGPMPNSKLPWGEWVLWEEYEPEKVQFT
jgi:hypothetical protein